MIHQALLNPKSIVVVGASNDVHKPGGKVLKNLIDNHFKGNLCVVNPKETEVQGIKSYNSVNDLPQVDLAIIAIAAKYCPETVEVLAKQKETRAFIILSAGFHEENEEGARLERQIVDTVNAVGGSLIGPNCVGVLNNNYAGIFTTPIPRLDPKGVDFITGSGATAVFILESGIPKGIPFSSIYSVGNSAQMGVEELLKDMDESFDPATSPRIKMLYVENIDKPEMLLKHASSLIRKGCKIAAIKSGSSSAGSRAASSHTGALASSDVAVDALFRKAGIVRCHGREELTTVVSIFLHPELQGKNIAVVTHAGGPAVMLTDQLSNNGLDVPHIEGKKADELLAKLFPGSSVANPIDFLATGTAEQLGYILDAVNEMDNIDGTAVIFGSPGLCPVYDVYNVLDQKMKESKKPIYPILPSVINVKDEIDAFLKKGRINFPEESLFGAALAKVYFTPKPQPENPVLPKVDVPKIRQVIEKCEDGYISPENIQQLLDAAGIERSQERVIDTEEEALKAARELGYPLVMKVVGPLHKSEVGGVVLSVMNEETVSKEFQRLMKIPETYAVLIYPMYFGTEVFIGASREDKFGHQVLFGLGGIFVEVMKDVKAAITPVNQDEAKTLIEGLKGYPIIKGVRGQEPVNEALFTETVARVSALVMAAPEIAEMDLNPLLGNPTNLVAVDARIRIEK